MQFVVTGEDKADALATRLEARPDHLAYWQELGPAFLFAGPFLDASESPTGSMIVIEADDLDHAERLAANDPYVLRGVFERHAVRRWNWVLGRPGGK